MNTHYIVQIKDRNLWIDDFTDPLPFTRQSAATADALRWSRTFRHVRILEVAKRKKVVWQMRDGVVVSNTKVTRK